jgi:hypothetical protein
MSDSRFFRKYLDILDEQTPELQDNPGTTKKELHPIAKGIGMLRTFNNLKNLDSAAIKNTAAQELSNVLRSEQDPSSKNVSILHRLFGQGNNQ